MVSNVASHCRTVTISLLAMLLFGQAMLVSAFHPMTPSAFQQPTLLQPTRGQPLRWVAVDREADFTEMMVGGERYELTSLPDAMMDTTLWVGNLCEFVHDDDLSGLFQSVSTLQSLPACVVRKANYESLCYGFVSFPTAEEKDAAIIRFHNTSWKGKRLKVEAIRDDLTHRRVRVPEKLVSYVSGAAKKTRNGKVNTMRRNGRDEYGSGRKGASRDKKKKDATKRQKTKKIARLSQHEREELLRASRKGYITLDGRTAGHGSLLSLCSSRALKMSSLASTHRDWCDFREKPNIILYKASGKQAAVLDHVVVDLSPLRLTTMFDNYMMDEFLVKWKAQIMSAAATSGMELREVLPDDNNDEPCWSELDENVDEDSVEYVVTLDEKYSNKMANPIRISQLPFVSMGIFVGERSQAKAMARELALLWELPEQMNRDDAADLVMGAPPQKHQYHNTPIKRRNGGNSSNNIHNGSRLSNRAHPDRQERRRANRRRTRQRNDWNDRFS